MKKRILHYLNYGAECRNCTGEIYMECLLDPREKEGGQLRMYGVKTGWLLCRCGFRFDKTTHAKPV